MVLVCVFVFLLYTASPIATMVYLLLLSQL